MSFPRYARGSRPIPAGVDNDSVSGLALPFVPSQVLLNVKRQTGILSLAASPRSATITANGFAYDLSGVTDNSSYVLDYLLLDKGNQFSFGTIPGQPSAFQGIDPVLNKPFAPIDYQLFINPILDPTKFPLPPGDPASLYWTVPDLNAFAYSFMDWGFESDDNFTIWYSNTDNNPASAIKAEGTPWNPNTSLTWIPGLKYVWAGDTAPTNPGFALDGGNTYLGVFTYIGGSNPGTFSAVPPFGLRWADRPADSIDHFELQRSTTPDFAIFDETNSFIPGPPRPFTITDPANRAAGVDYWYRMFGYTANGLIFPYNKVALIHPYPMSINRTAGITQISWQTPSLVGWP